MKMLLLPTSMQQELAARALRACMAAEAAMASLRAECKALQTASPQRVLALNAKNMGNAHRSLQLQIEACESFSLCATAAFKQLCDVIFCGDSEKSLNLEHNSIMGHENTQNSESSKAQVDDLVVSIDGELPVCGLRKSRPSAADESFARSKDDGEGISVHATTTRDHLAGVQVTEAEDTPLWGPENGAACTRFPSPETDNEATSRKEIVERSSTEGADWNRQLDSQHVQDREDASQSGYHILMSKAHEDSDASDLDADLSCEILSLRENSILFTNSSANQIDDGFKLHKTTKSPSISAGIESSTCAIDHTGNCAQINQPTTSDNSELSTNSRDSEQEHHATQSMRIHLNGATKTSCLAGGAQASFQQIMEIESPPYASDSHSGVSSHTATGSPPPASSSSNEVPEQCNSYGPIELRPSTPSFSNPIHASWTVAEVTCTQTPSSNAPQFSWSCESTRSIDTPSMTQPLSLLEYHPRVSYASEERWDRSKTSSNLPLYPAHRQPSKPNCRILPTASSAVRGLHQEFKPAVVSLESQDLALRKLQPLFNREIGHSPPSSSHADKNHCAEPNVPLTPSPYTLKTRSMFSRANLARKPSSGNSTPAPLQSSYGHSDGPLFSMATAVSLSSGYRQPSIYSGLPCGSSAYVSVMEKQAVQMVSETPLLTQFSVSPLSSSISTSTSSWENSISSSNSRSESSGREGSLDNYKKKLENLQEQFPRAHAGFPGEPKSSWGTTRIAGLASNLVGNSSLQKACEIPWQTSHMRATTTEVERYVCAASGSESTFDAKHICAQGRPPGEGGGYTQESVSDRSVSHGSNGSLESDSRYDGIVQGSKISEIQVSEGGMRDTSNRESCDVTSRELETRIDSAQKSQSRSGPTSWRWNHNQSDKETGVAVPVSSRDSTSDSVVMVKSAGDCARDESAAKFSEVCDSEDDDDDSSSTEREWNNILISMQQRGKPKA